MKYYKCHKCEKTLGNYDPTETFVYTCMEPGCGGKVDRQITKEDYDIASKKMDKIRKRLTAAHLCLTDLTKIMERAKVEVFTISKYTNGKWMCEYGDVGGKEDHLVTIAEMKSRFSE